MICQNLRDFVELMLERFESGKELGDRAELGIQDQEVKTGIYRPPDCNKKCNAAHIVNGILMSEVMTRIPKSKWSQVLLGVQVHVAHRESGRFRGLMLKANVQ